VCDLMSTTQYVEIFGTGYNYPSPTGSQTGPGAYTIWAPNANGAYGNAHWTGHHCNMSPWCSQDVGTAEGGSIDMFDNGPGGP
jgi:hypothetical protein